MKILGLCKKRIYPLIAQSDWAFFLCLADYLKFIFETPEINKVLEPLEKERAKTEVDEIEYEDGQEIELWTVLDKLTLIYLVFFKWDETREKLEKLRKDNKSFDRALFELWATMFKKEEIMGGANFSQIKNKKEFQFNKDAHIIYATRIHNYLIQKLNLEQEVKTDGFNEEVLKTQQLLDKSERDIKKKINAKAEYSNGILFFRDKEIDFRNKQNQKELLATLFKNPTKNWTYDEIYEDWGEKDFIKDGWRWNK